MDTPESRRQEHQDSWLAMEAHVKQCTKGCKDQGGWFTADYACPEGCRAWIALEGIKEVRMVLDRG